MVSSWRQGRGRRQGGGRRRCLDHHYSMLFCWPISFAIASPNLLHFCFYLNRRKEEVSSSQGVFSSACREAATFYAHHGCSHSAWHQGVAVIQATQTRFLNATRRRPMSPALQHIVFLVLGGWGVGIWSAMKVRALPACCAWLH